MRQSSLFAILTLALPAFAEGPPLLLHVNGRLLDGDDKPVNGSTSLTFRFYPSDSVTAEALWTQTYTLSVFGGVYDVTLGDTSSNKLPLSLLLQEQLWLAIQVNDDGEMTPRLRFGSTLWALQAGNAAQLGGNDPGHYAVKSEVAHLAGAAFGGPVSLAGAPTAAAHAASKQYVDDALEAAEQYADAASDTALTAARSYADSAVAAAAVQVGAPLDGDGSSGDPITLPRASASAAGYLHADDFVAFSQKVSSVSAGDGLSLGGTATHPSLGLALLASAPLGGAGTAASPLGISLATGTTPGAMSAADKTKLDGLGPPVQIVSARPTSPAPGVLIYNTTTKFVEFWSGSGWLRLRGFSNRNCLDLLEAGNVADGLYEIQPDPGQAAFQVWCRMSGDYPGAVLAIKRPENVSSQQNVAGDLNLPCTPTTSGYCKLSDAKINLIKNTSPAVDAYVVLSYKSASGAPYCRSFARKTCQWISNGAAGSGCENAVVRNSGNYCTREQTITEYRGIDGHRCPNLNYPGVTSPNNPFVIFEHSGGSHYCGGWDTTWDHIEMLIH